MSIELRVSVLAHLTLAERCLDMKVLPLFLPGTYPAAYPVAVPFTVPTPVPGQQIYIHQNAADDAFVTTQSEVAGNAPGRAKG